MSQYNAINPNLPVKETETNRAPSCWGNGLCIQSTKAEDHWIGSAEWMWILHLIRLRYALIINYIKVAWIARVSRHFSELLSDWTRMEDPNRGNIFPQHHYHTCDGRSAAVAQRWMSMPKGKGKRCPHIEHASDSGHNSATWGHHPGDDNNKKGTCDKLPGLASDNILTG